MERFLTQRFYQVLVVLVILVSSFSSSIIFPQYVHAQAAVITTPGSVTTDTLNLSQNTITAQGTAALQSKGFALDPIAWSVAKVILQAVVNSTVRWINSGFNGAPSFVTNLSGTLQQVGDAQANLFIRQLTSNSAVKSPFQNQIAGAVSNNYFQSSSANGFFTQNPFTLGNVSSNPAGFLAGNFSQGGLDAWFSTNDNPANNPVGAYQIATNELNGQVNGAQTTQKTELNWGSGFLSYRGNCQTSTTGQSTTGSSLGGSLAAAGAAATPSAGGGTSLSGSSGCQSQNIITPGGAISNSLYKSLGSGVDTLVTASQFNELVSALMSQLLNQVLGGGGLSGLSQPSASTGNVPYFNQTNATAPATAGGGTISPTLTTQFSQIVSAQLSQIQTFQTQWNTIDAAAQSAAAALQSSTCSPNAQATIASTVQPVINQATIELANASASITSLTAIEAEVPPANSTTDNTAQVSQASNDYSTFLSAPTTPSASDISYATQQSSPAPGSLVAQLNQITQTAQACTTTPAPTT